MIIQKCELASKLKKLKSILPSNPPIECIKNVLFKNNSIMANNLEMAMVIPLDVDTDEEFLLPLKAVEMIENLPDGEVKITTDNKHAILIEMDGIKNKVQSEDPKVFPDINIDFNSEHTKKTIIHGNVLQDAINSVVYAVADNESRPVLAGLLMESAGGKLNIVGTDGVRVAWSIVDYDGELEMIVPRISIQKLMQQGLKSDIEITYNPNNAIFKSDEFTFYSRLIEGEYIDYSKVFVAGNISVDIDRLALIESINRSSICANEKVRPQVLLDISKDVVNVSSASNSSEYTEKLKLESAVDNPIKIGFNARFLLECLKSYKCPQIKLNFSGELKPLFIEDSGLKSIVLPVKL